MAAVHQAVSSFITGVHIVRKKDERCPDDSTVIESTVGGQDANINKGFGATSMYLAYRRGGNSKPDDPVVADLTVIVHGKQAVPPGFLRITATIGGQNANLNKGGGGKSLYLCVKWGKPSTLDAAVVDLAVIRPSKNERCPSGYTQIATNMNEGSRGEAVYLCVRHARINKAALTVAPAPPAAAPLTSFDDYATAGRARHPGDEPGHRQRFPRHTSERVVSRSNSIAAGRALKGVPIQINAKFRASSSNSMLPAPTLDPLSSAEIDGMYSYSFDLEKKVVQAWAQRS